MGLARYFVLRHADQWLVMLEGRAMARVAGKSQAISSAIVMANLMGTMSHDADVMLEDGKNLRLIWTYGVDKVPTSHGRQIARPRSRSPRSHIKVAQVSAP